MLNTDKQALNESPVPTKVIVGDGNGAGNKPEIGRQKAEDDHSKIEQIFDKHTKMVFITAGMGGGTGTGAGPVVARIAHEKGILTVGIVTIPFLFEGKKKIAKALAGADEMAKYVDALLVINNEQLINIYPDLVWLNGFSKADDILAVATRSISELITHSGRWNLDFEDVNTTLRNGGPAIISTGIGEGDDRVLQALENALKSPLLKRHDVFSSKRVLINIYYNPDTEHPLQIGEGAKINQFMANFTNELDLIVGQTIDKTLGDEVKITVLATGFEMSIETPEEGLHVIKTSVQKTEERIDEVYGESINNFNKMKAEKQYIILRPEDMDNDQIINELKNTPTHARDSRVKAHIEEMRDKTSTVVNNTPHPKPQPKTSRTIKW